MKKNGARAKQRKEKILKCMRGYAHPDLFPEAYKGVVEAFRKTLKQASWWLKDVENDFQDLTSF